MSLNTVQVLNPETVADGFGDLPTLAPVAVEVLRLADDDRAGLDDIAEAISRDPGLAAQVLKVANSPMYGMGGEVSSLNRAASILGLRTVKLLSLSFAVVASTGGDEHDAVIWRRTLACSALAQTIANRMERRLVDEAFIAGLLASVGRLALMKNDAYLEATNAAGGWLETDVEHQMFATSGDEVAATILQRWDLPQQLHDAIRHRNAPDQAEGVTARLAGFLAAADTAAAFIIAPDERAPAALDLWHVAARDHLGLAEDAADELLGESQEALEEVTELFDAEAAADQPVTDLLLRAREGLARLSLDVVAALSQEQTRSASLANENERLTAEALTDALTGLPNRRSFDQFVQTTIAAHTRGVTEGQLGVMVLDLDRFKSVNDTHGHQVGDEVLREVGARLAERCRANEFVARMGGEEFAVVLPSTDPDEILLAANAFRKAVGATPIETSIGRLDVTTSVGTAIGDGTGPNAADALYERADRALYEAKNDGRNCVRSAD